ncbi:MAG: glycoside hydrolase family 28 protein [Mucilaginibacter sp.]
MIKIKYTSTIIICLAGLSAFAQQKTYNITDYGAKFDLKFNNAVSIQKAIDAASATGGGRVLVPTGVYVTGPIVLKTGVDLHLDDNAILLGSNKRLDFPDNQLSVISARDQQNIAITGNGIIDGNGRELVENSLKLLRAGIIQDKEYLLKRPGGNRTNIINFKNCTHVVVKDITLKNAASWVQDYAKCDDVLIDHITVESTAYWNNDGIDLTDSKNVKITNSFINSADDGICLKSDDPNSACDHILVTDCTIRSSASAFKFGTGSVGGFKNITVRNLNVYDTFRSAIALESVDGAKIENIDIRNVVAKNTGNALFIRLGHRNTDGRYSSIRHVYIANVKADIPNAKPDIGYPVEGPPAKVAPHNLPPSLIVGIPGHPVEDVVFENIEVTYGGRSSKSVAYVSTDSLSKVTESIAGYPEFSMFGEIPSYGLYVRHANDIKLKNIDFKLAADDFRPAIVVDDVRSIAIKGLSLPLNTTRPGIVLNQINSSSIKEVTPAVGSDMVKEQ